MALDDILTKLQAVRTKMTASVQNKGVVVLDNSTLYTIDKGISMIPQGSGEADTSAFEEEMKAIIGEDANIPPVLVSGMKFYKCASVDTSTKTWSGYELLLQDGVYVVSDVETTGLTYAGFTPSVNTMYNEDATFIISTLFSKSETLDGCIFAANMQTNEAYYNGETINLENVNLADAPGYTDGTKAANSGSYSLDIDGANIFKDNKLSFAASVYTPNVTSGGNPTLLQIRNSDSDRSADTYLRISGPQDYNYRGEVYASIACSKTVTTGYGWHHVAATSDSVTVKFYVDGVLVATGDYNGYGAPSSYISMYLNASSYRDAIFMKDLQIYNRVLEAAEVEDLCTKAKLPTA